MVPKASGPLASGSGPCRVKQTSPGPRGLTPTRKLVREGSRLDELHLLLGLAKAALGGFHLDGEVVADEAGGVAAGVERLDLALAVAGLVVVDAPAHGDAAPLTHVALHLIAGIALTAVKS